MPAISSGDRRILVIAGLAFLLLVFVGSLFAPSSSGDNSAGTTYSSSSYGAKAAYLLLQETGYHVERWQQPTTALKPDGHAVLMIIAPVMIPNEKQKAVIEQFVSGGGRVIATGVAGARFIPDDHSEFNQGPAPHWKEFQALAPSPITRAAPKITIAPMARWTGEAGVVLYGDDSRVVVAHFAHGKGDVLWLASSTPFSNAGITQPANLEFMLAAIGDKATTRVMFDEYVHGYGENESSSRNHPLMMALFLQCAMLACAAVLTFSRRSGPIRPLRAESRLAPLEFVETLGGLYQQAHAAAVAVDVYYSRFQYWITRRLGVAPTATPEELDRAVRDRWGLNDDEFLPTLQAAATARYRPDLSQNEALKIVQSLYAYATKLKLFSVAKENS
jgi:Domain of unknown function (DUF4350)